MDTKRCTKCLIERPLTEFNKDKSRRDGYRDRCKTCIRAYQAEWLPLYVERIQSQRQQIDIPSVKRCTQCDQEKPLTDFHKTPNTLDGRRPICNACACDYQHEHRHDPRYADKVRTSDHRKYHSLPPTEKKRRNQAVHSRHQERYRNDSQYRDHECARTTHKTNRRRLKKTANGGSHTLQEWRELCARYNHRCLCCGQDRPLTRDHVIPVDCGGTDDITNIQPLCRPCNSAKGNRTIDYR